jgi:hypothetical protein
MAPEIAIATNTLMFVMRSGSSSQWREFNWMLGGSPIKMIVAQPCDGIVSAAQFKSAEDGRPSPEVHPSPRTFLIVSGKGVKPAVADSSTGQQAYFPSFLL